MILELIEKIKNAIFLYKIKIVEITEKIILNTKSINFNKELNSKLLLFKIDLEMIYLRLLKELNDLKYLNTNMIINLKF